MKLGRSLVIVGVIAIGVGALFLGAYSAASAPLPLGFPPPTADGEVEIKHYPEYRAATVQVNGDLGQASSRAFSPLYRHISDNGISMTAPVETRYPRATLQAGADTDGQAAVSFLYRSPDVVPEEIAGNVQVDDLSPMTVVSLGVRGGYGYDIYIQGIQRLQAWLAAHPEYEVAGTPRRFFYDGPYIPNRWKRSDIQIPVSLRQ